MREKIKMAKHFNTFEELSLSRKKWLESSQDNGFDKGLLKLLTELYPDKAHFIYELLQNAEDAQASSVSFILHKDYLEFIHDGIRLFDLKDIDAITNIANSTKPGDSHSIGKYGVGFKAVFTYTNTPHIHSGDWNFKISNMVIPEKILPKKDVDNTKTYFTFPFDNQKKSKDNAYREIEQGLTKLPLETLLFLKNIKELNWEINGVKQSISKREENNIVYLSHRNDKETTKQYLRFFKNNINIKTHDGETKNVSVSLAYRLEKTENSYKIVPIDTNERNVFVYFPAEKENSKLRFLINAPFDSEISRASIRDTDDNKLLIRELVNLQLESMEFLRDNGYLTTEFLRILPNSKDILSDTYKEFHDKLVDLFNTQDFTPTLSGEFAPAKSLFRGESMYTNGPHLSEFITDNDLALIIANSYIVKNYGYEIEVPLWVKNPQQINSLSDFFLKDLEINSFSNSNFIHWLSEDNNEIWSKIIKQKDIKDLYKLYLMLDGECTQRSEIQDVKLFVCTDGNLYSLDDGVYLQPQNIPAPKELNICHFIDPQSLGKTNKTKEDVLLFLQNELEIEEFSQKSICQETLKKYKQYDITTEDIDIRQHMEDIKLLINTYKGFHDIINTLEDTYFVLSNENTYCLAEKMYLDRRFGGSHDYMKYVADILSLSEISLEYKKYLKEEDTNIFVNILQELEAKSLLWRVNSPCRENPQYSNKLRDWQKSETSYCTDRDYDIYNLDKIIERKDILKQCSKLIWLSLFQNQFNFTSTEASYCANRQDYTHKCSSKYIYTLTNNDWILDKQGNLCKPENICFDDLPDSWKRPDEGYENYVLKAIEFGKKALKQIEKEENNNLIARNAGFKNAEELRECKEIASLLKGSQKSFDDLKEFLAPKKKFAMPESYSNNPQHREEKIAEAHALADEQVSYIATRSVKNYGAKFDATLYLKEEYTNEDGIMYCQMCQKEMPFKKKDGEYYFETTQIFNNMKKNDQHQYLALCPNCAAEYKEWVRFDIEKAEELQTVIEQRDYEKGKGSVIIDLYINSKARTLYFTGKHYLDLRTVLKSESGCNVEDENYSEYPAEHASDNFMVCTPSNTKVGDTVYSDAFGKGKVFGISGDFVEIQFASSNKKIALTYLKKKIYE